MSPGPIPPTARPAPPEHEPLQAKFERQVDPEGTLPPAERAKRAENARRAHYQRLSLRSAQARRAIKSLNAQAEAAEAELAAGDGDAA